MQSDDRAVLEILLPSEAILLTNVELEFINKNYICIYLEFSKIDMLATLNEHLPSCALNIHIHLEVDGRNVADLIHRTQNPSFCK